MTEILLQKLEGKVVEILSEIEKSRLDNDKLRTEVERAREEIQRLVHENSLLRFEKENHMKKLQDLISLVDTVATPDNVVIQAPMPKPVLVQG